MARSQRAIDNSKAASSAAAKGAGQSAPTQRIDRFLWFARLTGNRSAAQALAERGIVRLNGRRVERAHTPVRPGDLLTLPVGDSVHVIRIAELPSRRGPTTEAQALYEMIEIGDPNLGYRP